MDLPGPQNSRHDWENFNRGSDELASRQRQTLGAVQQRVATHTRAATGVCNAMMASGQRQWPQTAMWAASGGGRADAGNARGRRRCVLRRRGGEEGEGRW